MARRETVEWLDPRQERAWRALQFMEMRLESELARQLARDSSLSYPDYVVLVALTDQAQGRLRSFELGATLGWEQSRLSHHVARMAQRGLVTKERCDEDRRGAHVAVTAKGRAELAAAAPGHVRAVRRLFLDAVSDAQLDAIAAAAEAVLARMDGRSDGDGAAETAS